MPKFAANLTMLYQEYPLLERIERAASAGFRGVEILYPYGADLDAIKSTLDAHDVELVLFNIPAGNVDAGDRGFANDPRRVDEYRAAVDLALTVQRSLPAPRFNTLVGRRLLDVPIAEQFATVRENLRYAADATAKQGVTQLVEPLNAIDTPDFLVPTSTQMLVLIEEIGHPNLRLQYDFYHQQRMEGNLMAFFAGHIGQIGHIQIADSPDRHEPGTGEINYDYVFDQLDTLGYDGWVALEYKPVTTTEASLGWLKRFGYDV
ncbi:MAG: TIM barrel protein [Thermomicrobiales bacterium]|nr:TIM barrel protein [Thermomicrobiales bacterium]MCO5220770.1 TIM barrel protein [Thermomicrobiales bacterium]